MLQGYKDRQMHTLNPQNIVGMEVDLWEKGVGFTVIITTKHMPLPVPLIMSQ